MKEQTLNEFMKRSIFKEQIVTFDIAKLAKEKNFNWPCRLHYQLRLTEQENEQDGKSGPFGWEKDELTLQSDFFINNHTKDFIDTSNKSWYMCSAPTQSLLQKWLREEHNLIVFIAPFIGEKAEGWSGEIYLNRNFTQCEIEECKSYEEALEKGLQEGLKLIK